MTRLTCSHCRRAFETEPHTRQELEAEEGESRSYEIYLCSHCQYPNICFTLTFALDSETRPAAGRRKRKAHSDEGQEKES